MTDLEMRDYLRENLHPIPICKCYFAPDIPPRKLKAAARVIAKGATVPEDVLALWDDSMLETGRSGLLFTKTALYWQDNRGRRFLHVPYHRMERAEVVEIQNAIKQPRQQFQIITKDEETAVMLVEAHDLTPLADCVNGLLEGLQGTLEDMSVEELLARKAELEARRRQAEERLEAAKDPKEEAARQKAEAEAAEKARQEAEREILPAAEAFQKAVGAVQEGAYAEAVKWFRQAAGQEDADAKFNLGVLYEQGLGVEADLEKAVSWYQESAGQNCPEAQCALGALYLQGRGVEADRDKARHWLEKAAAQGSEEAADWLNKLAE